VKKKEYVKHEKKRKRSGQKTLAAVLTEYKISNKEWLYKQQKKPTSLS